MRWSVTFISIEVAVSMLGYLRKAFFISCVNVIMQYCWFFGGGVLAQYPANQPKQLYV